MDPLDLHLRHAFFLEFYYQVSCWINHKKKYLKNKPCDWKSFPTNFIVCVDNLSMFYFITFKKIFITTSYSEVIQLTEIYWATHEMLYPSRLDTATQRPHLSSDLLDLNGHWRPSQTIDRYFKLKKSTCNNVWVTIQTDFWKMKYSWKIFFIQVTLYKCRMFQW